MLIKNVGSICLNRSNTPLIPKSGEQELQIAPIETVASIAMIVSGIFGRKPTTRSPFSKPFFLKALANISTSRYNCLYVYDCNGECSPLN